MITIVDFERRSKEGPLMKSDEFDLIFTRKVRELVKEYSIKYNPEELIVDDETADLVFKAGVELLADVGVYHNETQRVIKWTREEIEQIAREYKENPPTITFGRGKDEHTVIPRTANDSRRPVVWICVAGAIPQEYLIPMIQLAAQEESAQGFGIAGGITSVNGVVPTAGMPSEIFCGLWEVQAQKEALRRAGRPDMHLGLIPTVSNMGGTAALLGPGLREPHNSMVGIHIIPEQKIDWTRLNLAYFIEQRGIPAWTSAMSMVGGLCGGAAGVSIGLMANLLAQLSYGHGKLVSVYACDMKGKNFGRQELWSYSACTRAAVRNIGVSCGTTTSSASPSFSYDEVLLHGSVMSVALTANGASYTWGAGSTGLETRINAETMSGIAGMSREKANEILNSCLSLIEELEKAGGTLISVSDLLNPFRTKYDIKTFKPMPEFIASCNRVVEKLARLGVPFSRQLKLN